MHELPLANAKLLALFVFVAALCGWVLDYAAGNKIDYWIHDAALVYEARAVWKHTAVVVLDDKVPIEVGRTQTLPLFAKATERLVSAGVKGIFLDARVPKEIEGRMPYALCIESSGEVRWSAPQCLVTSPGQCKVLNSEAGNAPLRMSEAAITHFHIAPYLLEQRDLPDFLLYDFDAAAAIPAPGLVASDRLVTNRNPIARWMDLSADHAAVRLAMSVDPLRTQSSLKDNKQDEICDNGFPCRRVRLSRPLYRTQINPERLFVPLSVLAACDQLPAMRIAALLQDKAVVFQVTAPTESTDTVITAMTTALYGPNLMTPGAQFLADAVETLLNNDQPRVPSALIKAFLFLGTALLSVYCGAYLKQPLLWLAGLMLFAAMIALCLFNPIVQLWPVTATMLTFFTGAAQTIGAHLMIGFREGKLIGQYMPKQIHNLLITLKSDESFHNRRHHAVVLMSDLAGYTTVTEILKEPDHVLNLMNDYLNETSFVLQDKYHGWLEAYVGDMVCYYWPFAEDKKRQAYENALHAALELASLQKRFFSSLPLRYARQFDAESLQRISSIINAGIGLTTGLVVMGDLGPQHGVRKFGILGDPINLAARTEALTRFFSTEIIFSGDLAETAKALALPVRRLGRISVKGKKEPQTLYAVGSPGDSRFTGENIRVWEEWLSAIEQKNACALQCPDIYRKDRQTIENWLGRKLLGNDGVWHLDEK
ncbi:MAG: adenylate/guanylate cyclase domain-containing protein [Gammaproteobacteria bacterium]